MLYVLSATSKIGFQCLIIGAMSFDTLSQKAIPVIAVMYGIIQPFSN